MDTVTISVQPTEGPSTEHDITREGMLDTLQGLVGGYVEFVQIGDGFVMAVNEDGWHVGFPQNPVSTQTAGTTIFGQTVTMRGADVA